MLPEAKKRMEGSLIIVGGTETSLLVGQRGLLFYVLNKGRNRIVWKRNRLVVSVDVYMKLEVDIYFKHSSINKKQFRVKK